MNKLLTEFTGGFPFLLNDLRFIDDAVKLAIADLTTAVAGSEPVIIYGCQTQQQANFVSVSEGAIFWQGEIWHVYPHNFTAPNPMTEAPYWNFVTENGPEGSRTFENAETHQVHQIRKAVASVSPVAGALGSLAFDDVVSYAQINNSVHNLSLVSALELPGRTNPSRSIKDRSTVSIDAAFSFIALGSTFNHAASISNSAHFPSSIIEGLAPVIDNIDANNPAVVAVYKIDVDGKIYVRKIQQGSPSAATIRLNVQYMK